MKNFKNTFLLLLLVFSQQFYGQDWKAYKSGNYTYFENIITSQIIEGGSNTIEFRQLNEADTTYRIFKDGVDQLNIDIEVSNIMDSEGVQFTLQSFKTWKELNTGLSSEVTVSTAKRPLMNVRFSNVIAQTTLSTPATIDSYTIDVVDAAGFLIGQYLTIYNESANRVYFSTVLAINSLTITLDRPLDFDFPAGSFASVGRTNMNVDGSVTTQIFGIRNPGLVDVPLAFDVNRIMIRCLTVGPNDLSKFGDIAGGLVRGIVIRSVDGETRNIINAKTNADLKGLMFDFDIQAASGNQQDGFTGRLTFASEGKMGSAIRIGQDEDLQVLIQDNLTTLIELTILAQGVEVTFGFFFLFLFYRKS